MEKIKAREYADGTRILEDEFEEYDTFNPYHDDYIELLLYEYEIEDFITHNS